MRQTPLLVYVSLLLVLGVTSSPHLVAQSTATTPAATGPAFAQRVTVEAVRNRRTRTEGGDYDDKTDRISFTLKFANSDPRTAYNGYKGEFYVFAESILTRKYYQLLGVQQFELSLPPLGKQSVETEEWMTRYDKTDARFGTKYDSWVLVVRDTTDAVIFKKASNPAWMPVAEKMKTLTKGSFYDRALKETKGLR